MKKYLCTTCSYLYRPSIGDEELEIDPGTPFESVSDGFSCPVCGASEEYFHEISEIVNDPIDPNDPGEAELQHLPLFRISDSGVSVRIGTDDLPHPDEDGHFLEWVGLFDEDGEPVEVRFRPESGTEMLFEDLSGEDFSEIRACCSIHGVWRGIPDPFND